MKTSFEGLLFLVGHEAIVRSRYKDSKGVWTIGVGHTAAAGGLNPQTYYGKLSIEEVMDMFAKDIARYEAEVTRALKVKVKQHEFDAIVSWHYNTGAVAKATWIKKLNAGDRAGAIKGIMDWKKPQEIIPRRKSERDLFKTGVYPANAKATVYPATPDGRILWAEAQKVDIRHLLNAAVTAPKVVPLPTPKPVIQPQLEPIEDPKPVTLWAWLRSWFA